jgi:hypothetical protein
VTLRRTAGLVFCLAAAGLGFGLPAFAGNKVSAGHDPSVDFSALRTYRWMAWPEKTAPDPRVDNKDVEAHVQAVVDQQLAELGFELVPAGPVDFRVTYRIALDGHLETNVTTKAYGSPGGWTYSAGPRLVEWGPATTGAYVPKYSKGTLLIDFVDADEAKPLWRGSYQAKVKVTTTPEKRENRLQDAVRRILKKLPPR